MANTIKTYVSDGVRTSYPVDFTLGYLNDKSFVYVYQGEDHTIQLGYTWTDDENINLDAPVPEGEEFNIRRIVPRTRLINDYVDGAQIRERNLDQSYSQALMIIEEIEDGYIIDQPDWVIKQNLDMQGFSIINAASIQADVIIDSSGNDWYAVVAQAVIDAQAAQAAAEAAAAAAQAAEASAQALYDDFNDRYYGPFASDPATAPSGAASTEGDLYFNTTGLSMRVYNGTVWEGLTVAHAVDIAYNNTTSGLGATNVQDAIDELVATPGGINWEGNTKTASFTAVTDNGYPVSGTGDQTTVVTLPPIDTDGIVVILVDGTGEWDTKRVLVQADNPATETINGLLENLLLDYRGGYVQLISNLASTNWRVVVNGAGPQGVVEDAFPAGAGPFTMSQEPVSKEAIDVYVGNVWQNKDGYSISGKSLTITGGAAGEVRVRHNGMQLAINTPTDGSVTEAKLDTDLQNRVTKAMCVYDNNIEFVILQSHNVSGIVDIGVGVVEISFSTPMGTTDYAVVATSEMSSDTGLHPLVANVSTQVAPTVSACRVSVKSASDTVSGVDRNRVSVLVLEAS